VSSSPLTACRLFDSFADKKRELVKGALEYLEDLFQAQMMEKLKVQQFVRSAQGKDAINEIIFLPGH
jgi:hypothetical protein